MINMIFLQAAGGGNPMIGMLFPIGIAAVMYFFFLRPMKQKQDTQVKFTESLKEGMDVYTTAGIIGRITKIDGNAVRLLIDEKTFMRVLRTTIAGEYKQE
jgi:preprotein translocase subunit YajC